jgi:hypothetical protein
MSNQPALMAASSDSRRTFATALWTATTIVAVVVVSRRLGGHFTTALHPAIATLISGLLIAVNLAAALLLRSTLIPQAAWRRGWLRVLIGLMTLAPPGAAGFALLPLGSVSGIAALATLAIFSISLMVVAGSGVDRSCGASLLQANQAATAAVHLDRQAVSEMTTLLDEDLDLELDEAGELEDAVESDSQGVSQSMSRTRHGDGSETIEGTMVLPFAAGQQIGVAHLPFSPPFGAQPEVTCHLLDDSPVRLRVTATQTYGARVEAKRTGAAFDADEILIGYVVSADCTREKAA